MISTNAYLFILIALVFSFLILTATLIMLLRRKTSKDIAEAFRILLPTISSVFDNPFFWLDVDGETIRFANENAQKLLGLSQSALQNKNIKLLIDKDLNIKNNETIKQDKTLISQINFIDKNKKQTLSEITVLAIKTSAGDILGYAIIAEDIHEKEKLALIGNIEKYQQEMISQKKAFEKYSLKMQNLNASIKNTFKSPENNLESILKTISKDLHSFFESYFTALWIIEGDEEKLKLATQYGLSDEGIKRFQENIPSGEKILKSLEQKEIVIEDISSLSGTMKNFLTEEGVIAIAEIPFFENHNVCGVIEIYLKNKEDMALYKNLSMHISALLTALCAIFNIKLKSDPGFEAAMKIREEIEQKLYARIRSLEHDLEELKSLQQLTIGRELKMMELKRKNDDLQSKLEECQSQNKSN